MAKYKLGELAPIQQGIPPTEYPCWLLNLDMVESNTGRILEYVYVQPDEIGSSTVSFDTSNVLYSKLRPYLNKVVLPDRAGFATSEMLPLRPDTTIITREYLTYFLRSPHFVGYISDKTNGAKMPRTNIFDLKAVEIECPSLERQKAIVCIFEHLTNAIDLYQRQLFAIDTLIKARFIEMFGTVYDDRFPKYKLRELAHIKHGFAFSGEFFSDIDNGIVLVTPGNFAIGGGFQETKNRYFTSEYPQEYVLHAGDLIVTMTDLSKKADTLGYGAIVPATGKIYLHNQRIGLFDKLDQRLDPVFMRWFMQTREYREEIVRTSTGSTVHHTSPDRILDSIVFIPPIGEQIKFRKLAEQIDKSKVVVQEALNKAQLLFDSLMQKYFG